MTRLPALERQDMTADQRRVHDAIATGPRGGVRGPFPVLLRIPDLAERVAALGEQLRFQATLPPRLRELAVLVTAHALDCDYEWRAHARMALDAGVAQDVVDAIGAGTQPPLSRDEDRVVHAFARELTGDHRISDDTYRAATDRFGPEGVVELSALIGYFTMVATVLNAHEVR